jgi:ribosomal protein L31E
MDGVRAAAASGAPWIVYEANEESTFILVMPLRSRTEARRAATIPRAIRELRGTVYRRAETELFVFAPAMSRLPAEFVAARSRVAATKPGAH